MRLYLIGSALIGFAGQGVYTVLLNIYLLRLGYGLEFVGTVNAAGWLGWVLFCLPAGSLGGRLGIHRMLIVGQSLTVAGFGLLPLAEFVPRTLQAGWLIATYSIAFLGRALYFVNSNPFLIRSTSQVERNHVYSVQWALWPLAGFAGSLVGGLLPGLFATRLGVSLDHPAPYRYPLLISSVLLIPSVLVLLAMREVKAEHTEETTVEAGASPFVPIAISVVALFLGLSSDGAARTFFNVYLDVGLGVSIAQIGALSAVGQLLAGFAALAMPLIAARWGNGHTIFWGTSLMALGLLPMALIPHWGAAGFGFAAVVALSSIRNPVFNIYGMEMVPPRWRATMSGAIMLAQGLSSSSVALGGGYAITALGYRNFFLMGSGLTAGGALLFWAYFLRAPRGEFARRAAALDEAK